MINIENREDGRYIITDKKTDKNKNIVIKLDEMIEEDLVFFTTANSTVNVNISWFLKHDTKNGLYIELKSIDDNHLIIAKISEECIDELADMVKNNGFLEDCKEIQKAIYDSYNKLFIKCLESNCLICSNRIVEGIISVSESNTVLGHGTRFIINRNDILICEYTGKSIIRNINPTLYIHVGERKMKYICNKCLITNNRDVFNSEDDIGYIKYAGVLVSGLSINKQENDLELEYPKLKTPYIFTDRKSMRMYCMKNNTSDEIIKYKIALKGKVKILDVNKYMINEFLI